MRTVGGVFAAGVAVLLVASTALAGVGAAQSTVTLTVTVVDQDGEPLSDIGISATWGDGGGPVNETTRANGQALVDVPEGADVTIRVDDDTYVRNDPFQVRDASTRSVEVPVSRAATATVTVRDAGGNPVPDARVRLFRNGNFPVDLRTGTDGTVTTPPVEEGEYEVIVTKDGYFRNATAETVTGTDSTTTVIRQGSALVSFSVADDHFADPRPLRNASIAVAEAGGSGGTIGTVQTLSDGEATLTLPVNTRYVVTVTKPGYDTERQFLSLQESDRSASYAIQRTPELRLSAANQRIVVNETVQLTVTDEYGEPVANATVTRDGTTVGQTDGDGALSTQVPQAGTVGFTATEGNLSATATVEGVAVDESTPTATATATPTPTATATATPTDDRPQLPIDVSGPGFTGSAAVIALLAAALLALRRR